MVQCNIVGLTQTITGNRVKAALTLSHSRNERTVDISTQMILFANVVDHGSFSATARAIGQTPSAVSKQIGHLEDRLGIRLLNRSTRSVTPTEEGQSFYLRCSDIAAEVCEAEEMAHALSKHPQGTLRVAATAAFGRVQVLPLLPSFLERYTDLRVMLDLTDAPIDLSEPDYDMAIRFTEQIEDTALITRKLAHNKRIVCASPDYLRSHGTPTCLQDLEAHNCLRLTTVDDWNDWRLDQGDGEVVFHPTGNFEASSADAIYHATVAGLGISRLSTYLVGPDIAAGRLVHLLPGHCEDQADIFAVYSERRNLSPKVRVFIDFLAAHFHPVAPWEQTAEH